MENDGTGFASAGWRDSSISYLGYEIIVVRSIFICSIYAVIFLMRSRWVIG